MIFDRNSSWIFDFVENLNNHWIFFSHVQTIESESNHMKSNRMDTWASNSTFPWTLEFQHWKKLYNHCLLPQRRVNFSQWTVRNWAANFNLGKFWPGSISLFLTRFSISFKVWDCGLGEFACLIRRDLCRLVTHYVPLALSLFSVMFKSIPLKVFSSKTQWHSKISR